LSLLAANWFLALLTGSFASSRSSIALSTAGAGTLFALATACLTTATAWLTSAGAAAGHHRRGVQYLHVVCLVVDAPNTWAMLPVLAAWGTTNTPRLHLWDLHGEGESRVLGSECWLCTKLHGEFESYRGQPTAVVALERVSAMILFWIVAVGLLSGTDSKPQPQITSKHVTFIALKVHAESRDLTDFCCV
jgi:hypothetical protein